MPASVQVHRYGGLLLGAQLRGDVLLMFALLSRRNGLWLRAVSSARGLPCQIDETFQLRPPARNQQLRRGVIQTRLPQLMNGGTVRQSARAETLFSRAEDHHSCRHLGFEALPLLNEEHQIRLHPHQE
jgi:hypothetical protein